MKNKSAAADEYNEDTDGANDSDEDQWNNKLVIDEHRNMSTSDNKMNSQLTPTKDDSKNNQSLNSSSTKPKVRRGTQKVSEGIVTKQEPSPELNANKLSDSKSTKSDKKEKLAQNKPGRKRKGRQTNNTKATNGEVKQLTSGNDGDEHFTSDKSEEGISSFATGKKVLKRPSTTMTDVSTEYDWRSVGSITEPENLGPCESGTQVCLEGIVWQETTNGVLVVNVTWRGKSYMGTLLDATKYDWSPPSCESPVGDLDGRTPKGRGKRSRVPLCDTFKDINERKLRKEMRRQTAGNGNLPVGQTKSESCKKRARNSDSDTAELTARTHETVNGNMSDSPSPLIECPEPNCGKKYKQMNGLKYHQRNAHPENITNYSENQNDNKKLEPAQSPVGTLNLKEMAKTESAKTNCQPSDVSNKPEAEKAMVSAAETVTSVPSSVVNTTSVITSATFTSPVNAISQSYAVPLAAIQSSTAQVASIQSSPAPVAAITPQVIKPVSLTDDRDQFKSIPTAVNSVSRSHPNPHKLLPKTSNSFMAPISTITTQGVYNPTLKPIQPKPTRIPDASPNPSLNDLRDHKKLKRKRSESIDNLYCSSTNATGYQKNIPQIDEQKSNGTMLDMTLKSPSNYSDISDEGERKGLLKAETLTNRSLDTMESAMNPYLVAMVSPQQATIKPELGDQNRTPEKSRPTENRKQEFEGDNRQNLGLIHQYYSFPSWQMTPEFLQMFMSKEKPQIAVSPQPNSIKALSGSPYKTAELKASSERFQFLKENMELKSQPSHLPRGINDSPKDYSTSSSLKNFHENFSKYTNNAEQKQDQPKKDSKPPAHKAPAVSKPSDMRPDYSKASLVSSMPPPFNSTSFHYNMAGLANNFMLGGHVPFPLPGMTELKDSPVRPSASPLYPNKLEHKIHELDSAKTSQSPRPSHTPDRWNAAKTGNSVQPLMPPAVFPYGSVTPKN